MSTRAILYASSPEVAAARAKTLLVVGAMLLLTTCLGYGTFLLLAETQQGITDDMAFTFPYFSSFSFVLSMAFGELLAVVILNVA